MDESNNFTKKLVRPTIVPGCIACGSCQYIAPEVFQVTDKSRVQTSADFEKNAELIQRAADACPVNVIILKDE